MIHEILIPHFGANIEEGRILGWDKKIGDAVRAGDILCSYETSKATFEIEAEHDGFLVEIVHADGVVPVLTVIGFLGDTAGEPGHGR